MRYFLIILLCLISLTSGCEVFKAPFSLFQELLPLAIKYAPYALMLLETPEEFEIEKYKDKKVSIKHCKQILKDKTRNDKSFQDLVEKELKKNKKIKYIYIIPLENMDKVSKFINNYEGKVNYLITYAPNNISQQNLLRFSKLIKNVKFFIKDI